jgi:hypothetical protein
LLFAGAGLALLLLLAAIALLTYQFGRSRGFDDALATVTAQPRPLGLVAPTFTPTTEASPTPSPTVTASPTPSPTPTATPCHRR